MPLQALLVEMYERKGEEAGLEEAAQVGTRDCLAFTIPSFSISSRCRCRSLPILPPPASQICEALATELDPIRVRYWLGVVQARIHRRLVADIGSPSPAAAATVS